MEAQILQNQGKGSPPYARTPHIRAKLVVALIIPSWARSHIYTTTDLKSSIDKDTIDVDIADIGVVKKQCLRWNPSRIWQEGKLDRGHEEDRHGS